MPIKTTLTRWGLVILWMVQIFLLSAQSNPANILPWYLVNFLWDTWVFGQRLFFLLGPTGHLLNFAALTFLMARAFYWDFPYNNKPAVLTFMISFLYGLSDEIHQIFVPKRTFQIRDLLINGLGALLGLGFYMMLSIKRNQKCKETTLLL